MKLKNINIFFFLFVLSLGVNVYLLGKDVQSTGMVDKLSQRQAAIDDVITTKKAALKKSDVLSDYDIFREELEVRTETFFLTDLAQKLESFEKYRNLVSEFQLRKKKTYAFHEGEEELFLPTIAQRMKYIKLLDQYRAKIKTLLGNKNYKKYEKFIEAVNRESLKSAKEGKEFFIVEI